LRAATRGARLARRSHEEADMGRKFIDCREQPSESNCTVAISADSENELLEAAVQHAVKVHGHEDTSAFREQLKQAIKDGAPAGQRA
jgi:predicted small metal-binding protein